MFFKTWYHLTVSHSGTVMTVYVNGVFDSETSYVRDTADFLVYGEQTLYVGVKGWHTADVDVDELRLYNRSLTAAEALDDFNSNGSLATSSCTGFV